MTTFYVVSKASADADDYNNLVAFSAQGEGIDNEAAANEFRDAIASQRPWESHEVIDQDGYDNAYGDPENRKTTQAPDFDKVDVPAEANPSQAEAANPNVAVSGDTASNPAAAPGTD